MYIYILYYHISCCGSKIMKKYEIWRNRVEICLTIQFLGAASALNLQRAFSCFFMTLQHWCHKCREMTYPVIVVRSSPGLLVSMLTKHRWQLMLELPLSSYHDIYQQDADFKLMSERVSWILSNHHVHPFLSVFVPLWTVDKRSHAAFSGFAACLKIWEGEILPFPSV